jgi:hypothetical protein
MTEAELRELLSPHFPHIQILRQHLQPGVAFEQGGAAGVAFDTLNAANSGGFRDPLAYIAVCSRKKLKPMSDHVFFDTEGAFIEQYVVRERRLNLSRFAAYRNGARAKDLEDKVASLYGQMNDIAADREAVKAHRDAVQNELGEVRGVMADIVKDRELVSAHRDAVMAENAKLHADLGSLGARYHELEVRRQSLEQQYHGLEKQRGEELRSPRFLARQLWAATKQRIKDKL